MSLGMTLPQSLTAPDPGEGANDPGQVLPLARACVIDHCAFGRQGIASLVTERIKSEVLSLESGEAWRHLSAMDRRRPVSALVYRLPQALPPLLEALCFLRDFLTAHAAPRTDNHPPGPVILLSDIPAFWLYDTLRHLVAPHARYLACMCILPTRCTVPNLRDALSGGRTGGQLVRKALTTPPGRRLRLRGLNAGEVQVLYSLLVEDIGVMNQAKMSGVSAKTLYSQRLSAMRKLGVRSVAGLFRWRRQGGKP